MFLFYSATGEHMFGLVGLQGYFVVGVCFLLSSIVDIHHPDIFKFLSKLTAGERAHTEMCRREILRGENSPSAEKAIRSRNKRLVAIVKDFENRTSGNQYTSYSSAVAPLI